MNAIRFGQSGQEVENLQRRLNALGFACTVDGRFGVQTMDAVKDFQARAGDLEVDGVPGPITLARLFPATASPVQRAEDAPRGWHRDFLAAAVSQIGVRERGNNNGPEVLEYLHSVGLGAGNPWCAAFVYWCAAAAAQTNGIGNPLPRTAAVVTLYNWAFNRGMLLEDPARQAQPADIGLMLFSGGRGHVFIIEGTEPGGRWHTVEGNTNTGGSREGDGVYSRVRRYTQVAGVLRIPAWVGGS